MNKRDEIQRSCVVHRYSMTYHSIHEAPKMFIHTDKSCNSNAIRDMN